MLEQLEKAYCEEMIPIVKEAKQFAVDIRFPLAPPQDFGKGLVNQEKTIVSNYVGPRRDLRY
jgi:hypothetical protein